MANTLPLISADQRRSGFTVDLRSSAEICGKASPVFPMTTRHHRRLMAGQLQKPATQSGLLRPG
jgi:hypothetical protein